VRIGILGPLVVERDGRPVDVAGGRLRALLARLAVDAGRSVPAGSLADAIWDGDLPADEQHALQSLVSRLRRALGDGDLIEQSAGGYRLAVAAGDVDASRFTELAGEGTARLRDGDPERASRVLAMSLALWRGPALSDLTAGGELAVAAASLEDLRVTARVDRAEAELALGRSAELVPELEALAGEHPLHERVAGQLIQALTAAGRQADALAVYERVRARLADELGVPPSPELQQIHLAVLQGDRPAAASPTPPARSNLVVRLTSFVGRERELERIGELLGRHRLLTLVGAGGAGKTRLANEVGDHAVGLVGDGVWLVELAPVAADAAIAPAILASLGLREVQMLGTRSTVAAADAMAHLLEVLADKDALLVLDNCEHLLEPVARHVDKLLGGCPGLRVMCTSREPLGITGEMIVPIAPLELPADELSPAEALTVPAVRLFADRAEAASAGFVVDEDTAGAVIDVCRRVDGLPLAIELAAARLRSMTLPQLAARLDDRFRLLTGGSRTAMARQRTLRAVVDWSWDLLDDREQALLRRLAVFSGGAILEDVEAVCAGEPVAAGDVFDLLCALVDKSLLVLVDAERPRYRVLETIREYGLERMAEAGELPATRSAHAGHFAGLAIEAGPLLRGADQLTWLARLRADHDNVLAALRYLGDTGEADLVARTVVALLWFWLLSGSRQEVLAWTEFARAVPGDADPMDRLLIEGVHALARAIPGEPSAGDPWEALLATLAQIEDADLTSYPLLAAVRPMLAVAIGRERVIELLERSARHPDPWVRATVPFVRVQISENEGDMEGMAAALDEAIRAFAEVGDRWGLATTMSELSSQRILTGDLVGAEQALEQTRSLMTELGSSDGGGMLRLRLADVRGRRGDLDGARRMLLESLEERERFAEETAMINMALAQVLMLQGDIGRARELVAEARRALGPLDNRRPEQGHAHAMTANGAALVEVEAGDRDAALAMMADAYPVAVGTRDMPIVAILGVTLASFEHLCGRPIESAEILGAAARLRGAEDRTHPQVARLTASLRERLGGDAFDTAFARGRALSQREALARIDPARIPPSAKPGADTPAAPAGRTPPAARPSTPASTTRETPPAHPATVRGPRRPDGSAG
jgi:predicted ATPase/DNA-binding SARP family transcriptional activator